jgi:hypothetical protein
MKPSTRRSFREELQWFRYKTEYLYNHNAISPELYQEQCVDYIEYASSYVGCSPDKLKNMKWSRYNIRYGTSSVRGLLCEIRACSAIGLGTRIAEDKNLQYKLMIDLIDTDGNTYQVKECKTVSNFTDTDGVIVKATPKMVEGVKAKYMCFVDDSNDRMVIMKTKDAKQYIKERKEIKHPAIKLL